MIWKTLRIAAGLSLALLSGCTASVVCGEGTESVGEMCIPLLNCGEGTEAVDGECVPTNELACGEGTRLEDGECVAEEGVVCGPGTIETDEGCIPEGPMTTCGPGTVLMNGVCGSTDSVWLHLPFPAGTEVSVYEQHYGFDTTNNEFAHAVMFGAEEGTEFAAARSGVVVESFEGSTTGCDESRCRRDANYIRIDHGDGTLGTYSNLEAGSSFVLAGDVVCAGDVIGRTGDTGFREVPGLYFMLSDLHRHSLPVLFEEYRDVSSGVAFIGEAPIASANEAPALCEAEVAPSECPATIFQHMGITLTAAFPCSLARSDESYVMEGRNSAGSEFVRIDLYSSESDSFEHVCVRNMEDGSFEQTVDWPVSAPGRTTISVSAAAFDMDDGCSRLNSGFSDGPYIHLL